MYYASIGLLGSLLLIVGNQGVLFEKTELNKKPNRIAYRQFLLSVLFYYFTDILWGLLDSAKLPRLIFIDTSVYFIALALTALFWAKYIVVYLNEKKRLEFFLLYSGRIYAVAVTAIVIINLFKPILFTVDKNSVYHPLPLRYAVILLQIGMFITATVTARLAIPRHDKNERHKYRMLTFFGVIVSLLMVLQVLLPELPLCAVAYLVGTSLLSAVVIRDEKADFQRQTDEAKRIAKSKQSLSTLLNNIPASSFLKDAETGEYIACNQVFANDANKGTTDEVLGLTDNDIFDSETAAHFIEEDKKALSMNEPYHFYEDAKDAAGNPHKYYTTKLKLYDANDKLLLLGMAVDITEMEKMREENEVIKATYKKVLEENEIYEQINFALTGDYFNLYYINVDTDEYVEYGSRTESGSKMARNSGKNFFRNIQNDIDKLIYEEDRDRMAELLEKGAILKELAVQDVLKYYYRLMIDNKPAYVIMKVAQIPDDEHHIIIGISNIDTEMKNQLEAESEKEERKAYMRLNAFSRNLMVIYAVDPETDEYTEFNANEDFNKLGISKKGKNFFEKTKENALRVICDEDHDNFSLLFTKKNILGAIEIDGIFIMEYRLMLDNKPTYVRLKAAEIEEDGKPLLIIGVENVDLYVRREKQQAHELSVAKEIAAKDALTGVQNSHAFSLAKEQLNEQIKNKENVEFAFVVCDINGLKSVNDTLGHHAGDRLIQNACKIICDTFKHSRVFRVGGDEFVVICRGQDYKNIDYLCDRMNDSNRNSDDVEVAFGVAFYSDGESVESVFDTADHLMYNHKVALKAHKIVHSGKEVISRAIKYQFPADAKAAYESSPLSFVYYQNIDGKAVPILASEGFCRNTGMPREVVLEWLESGMFERMHPDDVGVVSQISDDFLNQQGPYDTVFRCRLDRSLASASAKSGKKDNEYVYIHGIGKWQTMPDGTELAVITYANLTVTQETTEERLDAYMKLRHDSFYTDPLTGIPNVNYLQDFGEEKIRIIRAEGNTPIVVYIDIYSMQSYNNQYGFKEGDNLIALTANAIVKQFPKSLVVRDSDDHFILITDESSNEKLERHLRRVNRAIHIKAHGETSGIRSGVCAAEEGVSLNETIDHAKRALKHIENDINREVEFFSQSSNMAYLQDRYIIEHFDKALKSGWIKGYYHAIHRVESGKVAAFEFLARWIDPTRGMISPGEFIPVLQKYHQLYKLDLYMFEQVCKEVIVRYDNNLPLVPVSVNFSRQDFDHADILKELNRLYDKYNMSKYVDKSYFIIEITEQDIEKGAETFSEQLEKIRENRYRLWLDDFGSGYSAISSFSKYEFDLIKFDMNLVKNLEDKDGVNQILLESMVQLAKRLGIHTLIEGVETEEQLAFIKDIGCELAQGFYYDKPTLLDDILLRVHNTGFIKTCETDEERNEFNKKWFE